MIAYDDPSYSCPLCSIWLDKDALCRCDDDPCCIRCHRSLHVERPTWRWSTADLDAKIRDGLSGWGAA